MGSYKPRHLKQESSLLSTVVSRKGAAVAVAAGAVVPALAAETASAAPVQNAPAHKAVPVKTAKRAWYDVGYGQSGSLVSTLQTRLRARGYSIAVDGSFGPATLKALKNFQSRNRVAVSGRTWIATWNKLGGVPSQSTSRSAPRTSSSSIVAIAKQYTGVPYVWGGSSPAGFDCSGFTQFVYAKAGKSIPRTASAQQSVAARVSNPQPGDLVFSGFPAYHVTIYAGNGYEVAASKPGTVTSVRKMWGAKTFGRI